MKPSIRQFDLEMDFQKHRQLQRGIRQIMKKKLPVIDGRTGALPPLTQGHNQQAASSAQPSQSPDAMTQIGGGLPVNNSQATDIHHSEDKPYSMKREESGVGFGATGVPAGVGVKPLRVDASHGSLISAGYSK